MAKCEVHALCGTFLFLVAVSTLVIVYLTKAPKLDPVCDSIGCVARSNQILLSINSTVDPCEDFFEFACGQFVRSKNYQGEAGVVSFFTEVRAVQNRRLSQLLAQSNPRGPRFLREVSTFFKTCRLTKKTNFDEDAAVRSALSAVGLDLTNLNATAQEGFSVERQIRRLAENGFRTNVPLNINVNIRRSYKSDSLLQISLEGLSMGESGEDQQLWERLESIFGFQLTEEQESRLNDLHESISAASRASFRDYLPTVMTVEELQMGFPTVNWTEVAKSSLLYDSNDNTMDWNRVLVNVEGSAYLKTLLEIIQETDPLTLALYQAHDVHRQAREVISRFPPPDNCLKITMRVFPRAINYLVSSQEESEWAREEGMEIMRKVRTQLEEMMARSPWYDQETYSRAKKKLDGIRFKIAFSEEDVNITALENFYHGLVMVPGDLLQQGLMARRVERQEQVQSVLSLSQGQFSGDMLAMVNAWYHPGENSVTIPMGILHSLFLDRSVPSYFNLATIGPIIGHELVHAFDQDGIFEMVEGERKSWYTERALNLNAEKIQCLIDKYNANRDQQAGRNVDGNLTLSENIADIGGVMAAYYAFLEEKETQRLPGINYAGAQLFWLSFGATECAAYTTEHLQLRMEYDVHSPARYRVNEVLQNVPEFSKDFQCPLGSPMNPYYKCSVFK